jgi:hypothetical protein
MSDCIEHGKDCPYGGATLCGEMVAEITAAMRQADEWFEKSGGSTRHHVRECLIPALKDHGLKVIRITDETRKE